MFNFYDKCIVWGCRVTVKALSNDQTAGNFKPTLLGVAVLPEAETSIATSISGPQELLEDPWNPKRSKLAFTTINAARTMKTLKLGFSTQKHFNITNLRDDKTTFEETATTGPSVGDNALISVFGYGLAGGDPTSITMTILLEYLVEFYEPKDLDRS
jgi:hypothetical protein